MCSIVKDQQLNVCWWVSHDIFKFFTVAVEDFVTGWVGGGIGGFVRKVDLLVAKDFASS